MNPLRDQENIEEMRKRLYSRGGNETRFERHNLTDKKIDVARDWASTEKPTEITDGTVETNYTPNDAVGQSAAPKPRRYRLFILAGSLIIFILVAAVSSTFLYFGGNQISSDNISISIAGPSTIGGGEVVSLQVGVTNQNPAAIDSATLIIKYPPGSRTIEEPIRNLNEERISINTIEPGEVQNISLQAAIFGEEGDQKQIEATIEYRISGSNGMFFKDSEPLTFQIITSPLVLQVTSVDTVASGQTVEYIVTAKSNATAPLFNVLVSAAYPNGFNFRESTPAPIFAENVWQIDELKPEESFEIRLVGTIEGLPNETSRISFNAGPAQPDNRFIVGATLADAYAEFTIERPFIDIDIAINGDRDGSVILDPDSVATVEVAVANTLDETVYDLVVELVPGGNALTPDSINSSGGFFDSNTGVIRFEVANNPRFAEVRPGDSRQLTFSIRPGTTGTTAAFDLVVNVYTKRISERNAQEQLLGSVRAEAKYSSEAFVGSQAGHMTGPLPPQTAQTTSYAVTLAARAGANNVSDAVVTTSLPLYVNWLDDFTTDGSVIYNPVSKQLEWKAGNISSGQQKELTFAISILPSSSQVGITPVLVNDQALRARDSFTGAPLTAFSEQITTELSTEAGYQRGNGIITSN